jgi:beta-lactamase class A
MTLMNRRVLTLSLAAGALASGACASNARPDPTDRLRSLERGAGDRLGAFVLDTETGRSFGWRPDERFCHCSTFKLSLAAMALREAAAGRLDLAEPLAFSRSDIVAYAPVVEANLDKGALPVLALAEAVQVTSDNAAANVLMRRLGGPEALTQFWRDIGDDKSRLDGYEPDINVIPPGTQENSTTPRAMAETVRRIVLGDVLSLADRDRLVGWMAATESGRNRIRAALPTGWRGLDKTGTGMRPNVGNKTNDLAVLIPPGGRRPIVVVGYFETAAFAEDTRPEDEAVLKTLGEIAVGWAN